MRIYYRGRDVVVTSELFIRCGSPSGAFAIRDLRNVGVAPDETVGPRAVHLLAAAAVLVAAVVSYGVAGLGVALGVVALGAFAAACAYVGHQHRPRRQELQASCRGTAVVLYASADERVFNQVRRALQRAIEDRPPSSWEPSIAA
jgi:dienelactone hydrolase